MSWTIKWPDYRDFTVLLEVANGRITETTKRRVLQGYLFDGVLVLCKVTRKSVSVAAQLSSCTPGELKLKEKYFLRKVEISDREDTEGKCTAIFWLLYQK